MAAACMAFPAQKMVGGAFSVHSLLRRSSGWRLIFPPVSTACAVVLFVYIVFPFGICLVDITLLFNLY